jgi:pimeloyl-ACP methyl ester carboxylesterase
MDTAPLGTMTPDLAHPKPTIILVPGAWHIPAHYTPTTSLLSSRGFRVVSVHNPTTRNDPPWPRDYGADSAAVASALLGETELGNDVVVVMHSYGGFPGGAACQGLLKRERVARGSKGGVVGCVYVSSMALEEGMGLRDMDIGQSDWGWFEPDVSIINTFDRFERVSVE